jgi:hypothetical protein
MAKLHRTQILLERAQYEYLKARGESESRSMSEVLRELVGRDMLAAAADREVDPLWSLIGSQIGGEPTDTSERVDELTYGTGRENQTRTP